MFGQHLPDQRNARRAAHQQDLVQIAFGQARITQRRIKRRQRALQQVPDKVFKVMALNFHIQMQRAAILLQQIFFAHLRKRLARQRDLGLLGGARQTGQRLAIVARIKPVLFLEKMGQMLHQPIVKIVAAQMRIAVRGAHFQHALIQFHDRHVERAAAQIVHGDDLRFVRAIQSISQRGRRRLIDDALHGEARDLARPLSSPVAPHRRNRRAP